MTLDEGELARVQGDLVSWGILEPDAPVRVTRRFRGALMRAAASLQAEEAAGSALPGSAVEAMVRRALEDHEVPTGVRVTATHRSFLVAVQLASLPDAVRQAIGE